MNYRRSASIFAVALLLPLLCPAQPLPGGPADDSLASYLKEWRWESPDGKSTIDVSSSSLMLFDGNLYDCELSGGILRFLSGGKTVPYLYDAATDHVTFNFADSARIEYHRTIQSVYARRGTRRLPEKAEFLFGRYATAERRLSDGATEQKTINFHANTEFDFGPRGYAPAGGATGGASSSAALGTVLVYEDVVIFSFYDSSAAEAEVEARDSRGDIRRFIYAGEVYTRVPYEQAMLSSPTPYPVPEPYPGPPPYPIPPLDPPYYPPYYPPYHPPYYHYPHYYPPVVGGVIVYPHGGRGEKQGHAGGVARTTGTHRDSGGSSSRGTVGTTGRPSGSSGSSAGGSSGSRGGSSGGSSRGGNRR
jgi:hypothetical protein